MKRISSLLLAAWMCVALVGCSSEEAATDGPALEAPASEAAAAPEEGSDKKEEGSEEKTE